MDEKKKAALDELDKELLRLKLEQPGRTNVDLAQLVKRSWRDTIRRTSRPAFKAALSEYQKKGIDIALAVKDEALRTLIRLMRNSKDERVVAKIALAFSADALPAKKVDVAHSGSIGLTADGIDWQTLSTEQLIRIKAGESPDLIVAELERRSN